MPRLLIAYDGSSGADRAVDEAARLFPGADATVLTCWFTSRDAAPVARMALSDAVMEEAVAKLDAAAREHAIATATAGAGRARTGGLEADAAERCATGATWAGIVAVADEVGADVVVVGSRGRSELASLVLGSTSHGVVHHCPAPVLLVHPPR